MSAEQHDNPFRPPPAHPQAFPAQALPAPPPPPPPAAPQGYGYAYPAGGVPTARLSATGYAVPVGAHAPVWPGGPRPGNGLGTAGFVLGVIAALLSWTFVLSFVVLPLAVLALIFGIIGASRARAGRATNRTAALSGLWTGAGSLAIAVPHLVLFVVLVAQSVEVESEAGSAYLAGAGDTVVYEDGLSAVIDAPAGSADGSFVTVTALVTNDGDDDVELNDPGMAAYADGAQIDDGLVRTTGPSPGDLEPGETEAVGFTVAVPEGTTELGVDFRPSGDHEASYWVFTLEGAGDGGPPAGIGA